MSSSNRVRASLGIAVGTLAVAALPAAVAASWLVARVTLLRALEVGVPVAFVLGLVAVSLVRRARYRVDRSIARPGERVVRFGRLLAWTGIYLALTGAIALGFYGLLVVRG
jgi:hypothetical protein